ncbi:MAG: hypothetical protein OXH69_02260 [Acidobacteria bacterium]|nr:hypothetical protein [Acidobacteriota bacterium]
MVGTEQLKADMAYVRAAAGRSETVHVRAYGFLWAVILLFGFSLVDFVNDPRWVNRYWMVASPIGFGLSIWLGRRAHRLAGQLDRQASTRWILHWLGYVAAGMLGNVLVISGQLQPAARGPLWVLLLALTYFQAGVHADRRLLPIGLLLAGCFLIMVFLPAFGSTVAGVLAAAALVAHALLGAPRRAPPR